MEDNKRFGMIKTQFNGLYVPIDEWHQFIFSSCEDELDCMRFVNALNYLHERAMNNGRLASELLHAKEQLEKENKELLKYKYLTKALEEVSGSHYIEELISDFSDGSYCEDKDQIELGKWVVEHGLSWEELE